MSTSIILLLATAVVVEGAPFAPPQVDAYIIEEFLRDAYSGCTTTVVTRTTPPLSYTPLVLLTVCIVCITISMLLLHTKQKLS